LHEALESKSCVIAHIDH